MINGHLIPSQSQVKTASICFTAVLNSQILGARKNSSLWMTKPADPSSMTAQSKSFCHLCICNHRSDWHVDRCTKTFTTCGNTALWHAEHRLGRLTKLLASFGMLTARIPVAIGVCVQLQLNQLEIASVSRFKSHLTHTYHCILSHFLSLHQVLSDSCAAGSSHPNLHLKRVQDWPGVLGVLRFIEPTEIIL